MIPKVANHLFLHTSRAVALVQNQSGALRNVLQSGPAASAGSSWSSTGAGAGPGGAKFNAGGKFYKGYTGAGRAFTQANSSAAQDGTTKADDDREDIKVTFVTPRSTPSTVTRTLARRHSLSFPAGLSDHEIGSGVLHTVQMHLRELHAQAASSTKDQQSHLKYEQGPKSPFSAALQQAVDSKDFSTVIKHVSWLISPSDEPSLSYSSPTTYDFNSALRALHEFGLETTSERFAKLYERILQLDVKPNLYTYIGLIKGLTDVDRHVEHSLSSLAVTEKQSRLRGLALGSVEEDVNQRTKDLLLKDDSFATAMRIFDALCARRTGPRLSSLLPTFVYEALLRACSTHGDVDAALRVFGQIQAACTAAARKERTASAQLWKDIPTAPTNYMYLCLLGTYVTIGDLAGAKEVFADFRQQSSSGSVERVACYPIRLWNKMIECYFKVGQPAGALRLLEIMMDEGRVNEDGPNGFVPRPASSTYTTIIKGFCDPSPSPHSRGNVSKPDIRTALSWFDRLLEQPSSPQALYVSSENPSRPNEECWPIMLDALVQASFEDQAYLKDLNRLYDTFVELAPKDGLDAKDVDLLKIVGANITVLEHVGKARQDGVNLDILAEQAIDSLDFIAKYLPSFADSPQGTAILARLKKACSALASSKQSDHDPLWIELLPSINRIFGDLELSATSPPPPPPSPTIFIDQDLSRQVDQWFPSNPGVSVHDCYNLLVSVTSSPKPRYPNPATLARLISGLGRSGDITAAKHVYTIAQQVLASPFFAQNPAWQSQSWFQLEDNMIIAYAHWGDTSAAFGHRDRITAAGGIPSADAYGALIERVKDTTDDTSNAMALFSESQMLGVKPNVYLYNTIISKLAKARKADFALELFQQMKTDTSLRPSSITYGAIIAACARVGDTVAAEQLFEEMISQPNFRPRVPPYNTMMQLYTHTKPDRTKVLYYFNKMKEARVDPSAHTYKLLIDAYGTIEPVDVAAMENTFKVVESNFKLKLQGAHWAALINAYGCVLKDLDKAISIFESIASHPTSRNASLPDAVSYESLINVLITHKRMDLAEQYLERLKASGVHMTAYIANLLIKGYAAESSIEKARAVFESLADPASGVAAPGNHVPHDSGSSSPVSQPGSVSYREPSTWEAMFRAELGNGDRDRAITLLERLKERQFPEAVYNRIRGIMLDDVVAPWSQPLSPEQSPSASP